MLWRPFGQRRDKTRPSDVQHSPSPGTEPQHGAAVAWRIPEMRSPSAALAQHCDIFSPVAPEALITPLYTAAKSALQSTWLAQSCPALSVKRYVAASNRLRPTHLTIRPVKHRQPEVALDPWLRQNRSRPTTPYAMLPRGSKVVVIDVDGTLTVGNAELFHQLLRPSHRAKARQAAVEMTWAWAARGYACIYLTGRPMWLASMTQRWFADMGFAPGIIQFTERHRDMLPSHSFTGAFKQLTMRRMHREGMSVAYAYGNVDTDVRAYRRFGLSSQQIITAGARPGRDQTIPARGGFAEHLAYIQAQPVVN